MNKEENILKSDYKQVIVMRNDLSMRKGKMIAQGAHASLAAVLLFAGQKDNKIILDLNNPDLGPWLGGAFKKICVQVPNLEEMNKIYESAIEDKIVCSYIIDNGLTEFGGVKTPTCICLGPAPSEKIDKLTKHLKLF